MYSLLERGGTSCCRRANAPAREQSSAPVVLVRRYFALLQALFEEITCRTSCTESPSRRVLSSSSPRLGSLAASRDGPSAPAPLLPRADADSATSTTGPAAPVLPARTTTRLAPPATRGRAAQVDPVPRRRPPPARRHLLSARLCHLRVPVVPLHRASFLPPPCAAAAELTLHRLAPLLSRPQSYLVVQRGETTKGLAYALVYSWLLYGCGGSFWMAYWRGGGVVPGAGDYKRSDEEARVADEGVKADVETFLLGRGSTEEEAVPRGEGGVETERLLDDEEAGHARPARGHARRMLQVKSDGTARFCRKVRPSPPSRWRNEADPGFPARSATSPSPTARTTARPVDAASSRWTITVPGSVEAASCVLSPALVGSSRRPSLADFAHAPPRLAGLGKLQVRASLDLLLSSRATLRSAIGPEPS